MLNNFFFLENRTFYEIVWKNTGCLQKNGASFKNLLNDYILQLDGAPPIFILIYESYSIVFSNSTGSDMLQMETITYTYYMGRIRLSRGCVSCDPGCTHWKIMINA
jgi:hypothetical protein